MREGGGTARGLKEGIIGEQELLGKIYCGS